MNAENLLQFLDELDEMQVWLREAVRPAFLAVGAALLLALGIALATRSVVLGLTSCVLVMWTGLAVSALVQHARDGLQPAAQKAVAKRR
ncbi:MAG: hypothetical protein AAFU65_10765 [Pseudomonadota bacterium]